jgi:hypothetical protein
MEAWMRVYRRVHHVGLGNCRAALEAAVQQCALENGGVVGHPTIVRGGVIVDEDSAWWDEWMRVHGPELYLANLLEMGLPPEQAERMLERLRAEWGGRRKSDSSPPENSST